MKLSRFLGAGLLAAAVVAGGAAQAQVQQVENGNFSSVSSPFGGLFGSTATPWVDNNVGFGGGVATFDNQSDYLWQDLGSFVAGTVFDVSFLFGAPARDTSLILNYALQFSTSSGVTTLSTASYNSNQEGQKSFDDILLSSAGNVRIYFDALSGAGEGSFLGIGGNVATIDNVSVMATAPIPEPETYALMLAGLGVVGFVARRRRPAA